MKPWGIELIRKRSVTVTVLRNRPAGASTSALGGIGQLDLYRLGGVIHERRKKHGFLLIHVGPVKAELANRPEDWPYPSIYNYTYNLTDAPVTLSGSSADRVLLPGDPRTRI